MNNKNLIIAVSIIVGAVILLGVGCLVGIGLEQQKTKPQLEKLDAIVGAINSKLIPSITAFGEIKSISGRNITLNSAGEILTVGIKDDAGVFSMGKGDSMASIIQTAEFQNLKVGDSVNVTLKITQDNTVEGSRVLIFPPVPVIGE